MYSISSLCRVDVLRKFLSLALLRVKLGERTGKEVDKLGQQHEGREHWVLGEADGKGKFLSLALFVGRAERREGWKRDG